MANNEEAAVSSTAAEPESASAVSEPDQESIATFAYHLWLARGCPHGSDQEDWFLAETILKKRGEEAPAPPKARGAQGAR
jgi:Protein of unknown function (DUF2934)